ncbi:MAG TPA: radical SAM protein [Mycobacterium sp.]|nr:radical SAM protein [Mycobacterium sp.]
MDLPVIAEKDATLRIKIHDPCGFTCTFCHNEGTPVVADNRRRPVGDFTTAGPSGRMSIYAATNGATFLPGVVRPDERFTEALTSLRDALDLSEVHFTGGEPTLHPSLAELTQLAADAGYGVRMTSNGERGAAVIPAAAAAGLRKVNFSVFGTTAAELAEVQHARFRNVELAERKIAALKDSIATCEAHGVKADANIVVLDHSHAGRVHRLLDEYSPQLSVRLLNSLDHGQVSIEAIETILAERGAVARAHYVTAGVSGARTSYELPDGRTVYFKEIRPVRLPDTCASCRFNNDKDCQEGFYGVRLYVDRVGTYQVGVCIQRMDLCLPLEEFLASSLPDEIVGLRTTEASVLAVA